MRTKIFKTLTIFGLCIIVLIIALLIFIQTETFKNIIKRAAEKAVSSTTKQDLTIGKIEGNFFSGIKIKNISFNIDNEEFISLEEISIDYSLLLILDNTMLFSKRVPINDIQLKGLHVNLIHYEDGKWNFNKLAMGNADSAKKDKQDKKRTPLAWSLLLRNFALNNAEIEIDDRIKNEVDRIDIPNVEFSLKMIDIIKEIEIDLMKASVIAPKHNIDLKELSTKAFYSLKESRIEDLKGILNGAEIKFDGEAINLEEPEVKFKASARGYELGNAGILNLEIEGSGLYKNPENINADVKIDMPDSKILGRNVRGSIERITMDGTKVELKNGELTSELGETSFSGNADIKGLLTKKGINQFDIKILLKNVLTTEIFALIEEHRGKKPKAIFTGLNASLNADLDVDGSWDDIKDFEAKSRIGKLVLQGPEAGILEVSGLIEATRSKLNLDLTSKLNKVNLASVMGNENYKSDITSNLILDGSIPLSGRILDNLNAELKAEIQPSSIYNINITEGNLDASYSDKTLDIRSFSLVSDKLKISAVKGKNQGNDIELDYEVESDDLSIISIFLPDLEFEGSLKAAGNIEGDLRKPKITLSANVSDFEYKEDFKSKSIELESEVLLDLDEPQIEANGKLNDIEVNNKTIESAEFRVQSEGTGLTGEVSVVEQPNRGLEVDFRLDNLMDQEKNLIISKLKFDLENTILQNEESINLIFSPKALIVKSFNLYYNNSSVLANADVRFAGAVDADLKLNNFKLNDISEVLELKSPILGVVSGSITLDGTLTEPIIKAAINAQNLGFREFESDITGFNFSYLNQKIDLKLNIDKDSQELFLANGTVDVDLNLKQIGENLNKGTLNLGIKSRGIDMSPISGLIEEINNIDGTLITDIRVRGTIKRPIINGEVNIRDANLRLYSLKNNFQIPEAILEFDGQRGVLRTLEIQSEGGTASLSGEIDLSSMSYSIKGNMDRFEIKPEDVKARLTGNLELIGNEGKIAINGDINVPRARLIIPDEPQKKLPDIKFLDEDEKEEFVIEDTKKTNFFVENIAIHIMASIPGNALIRGRGANIEVKGKLDVKKQYGEQILLFGTANAVRGTYRILGKVFTIERGSVAFRGSSEINPLLDIQALYEVSDVRVFINISGTAKKPELKFASEPPMQETDILSYLVFGVSSDKIGAGERSSIGGVAAGIAGGIAANELKGILGDELSPDVLKIGAGEGGAEIEVGKYITDDLYVSYQRGMEETPTNTSNLATDWIFVEYRIFDFLTLDSQIGGENSGADLFYNFNF